MQQTPDAPQPPAPPVPTGADIGGRTTTLSGAPVPLTAQEVANLRARRSELSDQLISAANRRDGLLEELIESPPGPVREGIEERIRFLDDRILGLEADIAETGAQLTAAGAVLTTETQMPFGPFGLSSGQVTGMSIVFILFVLAPLVIVLGMRLLRRPHAVPHSPVLDDMAKRMERMENAVDAVAVEVERISEGQRFVSRLLGEGQRPAEPVRIQDAAGQRVPRGGS